MKTDTPRTNRFYASFADGECIPNQDEWLALCESLESELTAARAEIERLDVSGIHSCHDNCQRPNCVLRKELKEVTNQCGKLIKTIEPLEYWRDISECDCSNPLPQGGCLRCDLERILKTTNPNELCDTDSATI
jgi:hypothetical protein